ncbi:hypothetical protein ACFLV8_02250 [Chloroflexota bacterium]
MSVIDPRIRGATRLRILRAHRVIEYLKAVDDYYAGRCSLEHLFIRGDKMLEIGLPPVRNKTAKKWKK